MESQNSNGKKAMIMEELVRGRDFANHLLHLVRHDGSHNMGDEQSFFIISRFVEDLVNKILRSFMNALLLFNSSNNHRIIDSKDVSVTYCSSANSNICHKSKDRDEGLDRSCHGFAKRNQRGCYKRKKNIQACIKDSPILVDDGHAWRKYGQKLTTNAKFLRNYYRCTHKYDQGCPAMKQVQRIREKPALYRTTYYGLHTCTNNNNPFKHLDPTSPSDSSSLLLSFNSTNNSNSNTLPTQQYHHHHPFLSSSSSTPIPKKEHDQKEIDGFHVDHHSHMDQNQPSLSHEYDHQPSQHKRVSDVTVLSSTLDLCSSVKVESFEAEEDVLLRCFNFDEVVCCDL